MWKKNLFPFNLGSVTASAESSCMDTNPYFTVYPVGGRLSQHLQAQAASPWTSRQFIPAFPRTASFLCFTRINAFNVK